MITQFAKWWLSRRGFFVERLPETCLMVSGYASANQEADDGTVWTVEFPRRPSAVITLKGSVAIGNAWEDQ